MTRRVTAAAVALGAVSALLGTGQALAVDGALYEYGWPSAVDTNVAAPTWTATRYGDEFDLSAPAGTATVGPKWWMSWNQCASPGMVAWGVRWSARRTADSTSARLQFQVQRPDGTAWGSANLRDGLTTVNTAFEAPVGVGCSATLLLQQIGGGTEPVRHYWVAAPRIVMQDVSPPALTLTGPANAAAVTAGQTALAVTWTTADNMGADGVLGQRVLVDGAVRWSGVPGVGSHAVSIPLTGVADGEHAVRVEVDGDGTLGAAAQVVVRVDRTPPVATGLAQTYSGAPGSASFHWTAGDPSGGSGMASTEVQVNAATDASTAGSWVTAASRLGDGQGVAPDIGLSPLVADGMHAWRLVLRDAVGNSAAVAAPAPVAVDTTAPEVAIDPVPPAYVSAVRLGVVATDNLQTALGIGSLDVDGNAAPDGTATGAWLALVGPLPAAPGRNDVDVPVSVLTDGDHVIRVRVRNGDPFGATLVGTRTVVVRVDGTSPAFGEPPRFASPAPGTLAVQWLASDALAGVSRAEVEWRDGAVWRPLAATAAANGAGQVTADTSTLPEGVAGFRLRVLDGAGNAVVAAASIGVDRTPPAVRGLLLTGPPWTLAWSQSDAGGFGACPTVVQVSGPGTGFSWRELVSRPMGEGAQSVVLPLAGLALGAYRVGVVACDAVGNTTSAETGGLAVTAPDDAASPPPPGGSARPAPGTPAVLRGARLSVRIVGARRTRRIGRIRFVARVVAGRAIVVRGRLLSAARRPLSGETVHVRDARGRVLGRGRTGAGGRFRIAARPVASGALRVGVPAGGGLLPGRADVDLGVRVTPVLSLRTSAVVATALGAPVVLTGRLTPAPAAVGATRKAVALEWRDPRRGAWRTILAGTTDVAGRFRFTWRFQTPGQRVLLRVRIAPERGWPLELAPSPTVVVSVR